MARTLLNAAKSASNVVSINQVGWALQMGALNGLI